MDLEKLIGIGANYLADYIWVFFTTLRKPSLIFQPLQLTDDTDGIVTSFNRSNIRGVTLSPKIWSFIIISIFMGSTLHSLVPQRKPFPTFVTTIVLVIVYWFLISSVFHIICKIFGGFGVFMQTLSVSLQVFAVIHVLSSFAALTWGILITETRLGSFLASLAVFLKDLANDPAYVYFWVQLVLLVVYLPLAATQVHKFSWWRSNPRD